MIKLEKVKNLLKKQAIKRPILACINYKKDEITYTESHGLVSIKHNNRIEKEFNYDTQSGLINFAPYPDTQRIKISDNNLLEKPINFSVISDRQGTLYYTVDNLPKGKVFNKKLVDDTFGTLTNKKFSNVLAIANELKIYVKGTHLIYKDDIHYILVLGLHVEEFIQQSHKADNLNYQEG